MRIIQRLGFQATRYINSDIIFFRFIGHLASSIKNVLLGRASISWQTVLTTMYQAGARLAFPLVVISAILGLSSSLNLYYVLSQYKLQTKAIPILLTIITFDVVPMLIGVVICMQSALNLISIEANKLHKLPHEVVLNYIIPIIIGTNITAFLLYVYTLSSYFIGSYVAYHFIIETHGKEFLFYLGSFFTIAVLILSLLKAASYCTIASLVIGYYYYEVAISQIAVRVAVSRIITRGLLWIALCSLYFKLFNL